MWKGPFQDQQISQISLLLINNNLKTVVMLLINALDTRFIKEATIPKIKEILIRLQSTQSLQLGEIWTTLTPDQQKKVSILIT